MKNKDLIELLKKLPQDLEVNARVCYPVEEPIVKTIKMHDYDYQDLYDKTVVLFP